MSYVKHLVSKKKKRYIEDGFDLDLAYIKPNIVAMGFPSENLEGVYRNHFEDVVRFLETKHGNHYRVYNLCSEKVYDPVKFKNRVSLMPFDDHNAPPFELMETCCKDMYAWISKDNDNVAIVHCKAGKGRTGVMICAYLLYTNHFDNAEAAMNFYGEARTYNAKGVTIPSQRRYITYYGYSLRKKLSYTPKTVLLDSITFVGIPTINSGACSPSFVVYQTKVVLHKSKSYERKKNEQELEMKLDRSIPICGDIKIDFFHKDIFRKERMFLFWFNTFFLEHGVTLHHPNGGGTTIHKSKNGRDEMYYELQQWELDKANKDKKHKFFPSNFKIRLHITIPDKRDLSLPAAIPRVHDPSSASAEQLDGPTKFRHRQLITEVQERSKNGKEVLKASSLQRDKLRPPNLSPDSGNSAPSSPCSRRLQSSNSSPIRATTPLDVYNRNMSRSLEALRVEDEPLSDDDDDDCDPSSSSSYPITRV